MNINYYYNIINVNNEIGVMEVEYSSEGLSNIIVGMPIPKASDSLELIIRNYAPIHTWITETKINDNNLLEVEIGTSGYLSNTNLLPSPVTLEDWKNLKLTELANWRYNIEVSGILVNGYPISTSRESRLLLLNAYTSITQGIMESINWKTANNTYIVLNASNINDIYNACINHVQMCYDMEKTYVQTINACTSIEEVKQIKIP